jgi:IS605 OrfB family transposase
MIKSTKTSIKFTNINKKQDIKLFLEEYKNVMSQFINVLWEMDDVKPLLDKNITSLISTWLSARMIQCAGKQASGVVRGVKKKQSKRKYMIDKLHNEGMFKKARKLQRIYDEISISKPNIDNIEPELDARFIKTDLNNATTFDGWLTISSIGNRQKIIIPFKKSKHFNKMLDLGILKTGIRLSNKNITFMFDIPDIKKKVEGSTLGIAIGVKNVLSCSNNHISQRNEHGYDLDKIMMILSRKKKGSKSFKKTEQHRTNYINWTINQLNLKNVKQVNLENIKYLRKNKKINRKLSHWTYTEIFGKLESYCNEQGVLVNKINPTYTSQRCSNCGWTLKSNRKGKLFKCDKCSLELNADLNASRNIALPLKPIWKKQRLKQNNRKGFYWLV